MDNETPKHLSYFKVENFKNFSSLELEDISLFNVIVGDNNVGKTNLLEAVSLNELDITSLLSTLDSYIYFRNGRQNHNILTKDYISNYFNNDSKKNQFNLNYKYEGTEEIEHGDLELINKDKLTKEDYDILVTQNPIKIGNINNVVIYNNSQGRFVVEPNFTNHLKYSDDDFDYMPFIFSNQSNHNDLIDFFGKIVSKSKEQKQDFINKMKIFLFDLETIEISQSNTSDNFEIFMGFKNKDKLTPLSMFGDGAIKYFRILLEILLVRNSRLAIDEIDNGIHYSKQSDFIEKIILSAIENKTQIFCTTHSKECLKSIKYAFEKGELKNHKNLFRCFSLNKTKKESVKAFKYDFEEFSSTLESDADIRGGF